MTDISHQQHSHGASAASTINPRREADTAFLRRILFGLIAATMFSGAVTVALTSQLETEGLQVASTHGPA